MIDLLWSSRIA